MKKKILIGLGILVVGLGGLAFLAPTHVHVEREIVINRPVDSVFVELRYLKNHADWSPWDKKDPKMTKNFRGNDGEVGAVVSWQGNDQVGVGEQEIKSVVENERIDYELRFKKPFESTSAAYFTTEANGDNTIVRWGMDGDMPFPGNIFCLIFNMKKHLAADFDLGLAGLKAKLEK